MQFFSTKNNTTKISLKEAIFKGLPEDNGLFVPEEIPTLPSDFFDNLANLSDSSIAFAIAKKFVGDEIPDEDLQAIVADAINFNAPLVQLNEHEFILELFHGQTFAFKDFGARFMARIMNYWLKKENKKLRVLVATSGDTGSAVAHGFYDNSQIAVTILFPKGKVSAIQQKQFTTLGKNITAIAIDGTFDDCQRLVKAAFLDADLQHQFNLSSANSINIARLIPQSFYYFFAYKQLLQNGVKGDVSFVIPSGNFGNLTAGFIAKKMGLPIHKLIAATNANTVFSTFLESGNYEPQPSVATLSNAMDVGNPSNFQRLQYYFPTNELMQNDIAAYSFSDAATIAEIIKIKKEYNYTCCPHTAVGLLAAEAFAAENPAETIVTLSTAHPAKFKESIDRILQTDTPIPPSLQNIISGEEKIIYLSKDFTDFKEWLMQ